MKTHTQTLTIAALLTTLIAAPAAADTLEATLGQPLKEVSHAVDVRVEDGLAVYTVRRSFSNTGKRHEEASLAINLPYGAAATGLRIKAKDKWYKGELMEREKAAELYRELTGMGPHTPRDPALLQWVWADQIHLHVFPVIPGATSTIEYTLTAPTLYSAGRHVIFYPRHDSAPNLAAPVVRIFPEDAGATVTLDGQLVAAEQPVTLSAPSKDDKCALGMGNASCVSSLLTMDQDLPVATLKVTVDIRHTYRSDLRVSLDPPSGKAIELFKGEGAGENDVRETFEVKVPAGTRTAGEWTLIVSDHAGLDVGTIDAWSLEFIGAEGTRKASATDLPRFIPDAPNGDANGHSAIEITPPRIRNLNARLGRVEAAADQQFMRLEIDAAPQLRPMPEKLQVVFVLDASHSVPDQGIDAQLDVARAFLTHVPDAAFEIVAFRRKATRIVGGFAPAPTFAKVLEAAKTAGKLDPGNGSALDEGLMLASRTLAGRTGPKTIVFLTDTLLRPSWHKRDALKALARTQAVVHAVLPEVGPGGDVTATREDTHDLSPIPLAHGGILTTISGLPASPPKTLDRLALGLVRPVRIDNFEIVGVKADELNLPDTLEEGSGVREMLMMAAAPTRVELRGHIWAEPFRKSVLVSMPFSRASAAFVFSHDMHDPLSDEAQLKVAFFGRAVSPVTSYLAIEPGVRPSTAGIDRLVMGHGAGGMGMRGTGHGGGGYGRRIPPSFEALMEDGIKTCIKSVAPPKGWGVAFDVETTYDEVVDVVAEPKADKMTRCLVEEAWKVRLDDTFDLVYETFNIYLP